MMSILFKLLIRQDHGNSAPQSRHRSAVGLPRFAAALVLIQTFVVATSVHAQNRRDLTASDELANTDTERQAVLDLETIERVESFMAPKLETQSWLTFSADGQGLTSFRNATGGRGARGGFWRWDFESKRSRSLAPANVGPAPPHMVQTPDGKQVILSNAPIGQIVVFDGKTMKPVKTLVGHKIVASMAISPNGHWLASMGRQGNLLLWDLRQEHPRPALLRNQLNRGDFYDDHGVYDFYAPLNDGSGVIHYDPNADEAGLRLIPADGGQEVLIWKPVKGKPLMRLPFALSPDGSQLFVNDHLIDVGKGQVIRTLPVGHNYLRVACWSPDGRRLAVAVPGGKRDKDRDQPNIVIWNVVENRQEALLVNPFTDDFDIHELEFSPDGTRLLAEGVYFNTRFIVWNVPASSSNEVTDSNTTEQSAQNVSGDSNESTKVYELEPRLKFKTSANDAESVHFLSNDRIFTKSLFIDLTTGLQQKVRPRYWKHYDVSMKSSLLADGKTMIAFDSDEPQGRYVLDVPEADWQEIPVNLKSRVDTGAHGRITLLEATPDGQFAAAFTGYGSEPRSTDYVNRSIHIWSIRGQQTAFLGKLSRPANSMVFSNQGYLVTGGDDGDVALWNPATRQQTQTLNGLQGRIWSVDVSADSAKIAAAGDRGLGVWTAAKEKGGDPVFFPLTTYGARYVKFSPSGKWAFVFYSAGAPELIEPTSGRTVARFEINGVPGTSFGGCAFSPDESTLAIAGHNYGFRGVQVYSLP